MQSDIENRSASCPRRARRDSAVSKVRRASRARAVARWPKRDSQLRSWWLGVHIVVGLRRRSSRACSCRGREVVTMDGSESKIAHLEKELADVRAAAHRAEERRNEFLAMLSHELRNPLAAILNALQLCDVPNADETTFEWSRIIMRR